MRVIDKRTACFILIWGTFFVVVVVALISQFSLKYLFIFPDGPTAKAEEKVTPDIHELLTSIATDPNEDNRWIFHLNQLFHSKTSLPTVRSDNWLGLSWPTKLTVLRLVSIQFFNLHISNFNSWEDAFCESAQQVTISSIAVQYFIGRNECIVANCLSFEYETMYITNGQVWQRTWNKLVICSVIQHSWRDKKKTISDSCCRRCNTPCILNKIHGHEAIMNPHGKSTIEWKLNRSAILCNKMYARESTFSR